MYMTVKEVIEEIDGLKKLRERTKKNLETSVEKDLYDDTAKFNDLLLDIEHDIEKLEESRILINGRFYLWSK